MTATFAARYLRGDVSTLRAYARLRGWNRDRAHATLTQSLVQFLASPHLPWYDALRTHESVILIADAIWYRIRGRKTTVYLLFLRPVTSATAVVAPPIIRSGHEDRAGWDAAFATVPASLQNRIKAVVCDGGLGIVASVRHHGWLLQRCHFHLLANLQMYCGRWTPWARQLLADVRTVLSTTNTEEIRRICKRLAYARTETRSRGIRRILTGFLTTHREFLAYLQHPELRLPTTTNTAESYISGLQNLKRRVRGFPPEKPWSAGGPPIRC